MLHSQHCVSNLSLNVQLNSEMLSQSQRPYLSPVTWIWTFYKLSACLCFFSVFFLQTSVTCLNCTQGLSDVKMTIEYKFSTIYSKNKFKLSSLQQTQNKQTLVFTSQYFLWAQVCFCFFFNLIVSFYHLTVRINNNNTYYYCLNSLKC